MRIPRRQRTTKGPRSSRVTARSPLGAAVRATSSGDTRTEIESYAPVRRQCRRSPSILRASHTTGDQRHVSRDASLIRAFISSRADLVGSGRTGVPLRN